MDIYAQEIEDKLEEAAGLMTVIMLEITIMSLKQIKSGTWIFKESGKEYPEPDF